MLSAEDAIATMSNATSRAQIGAAVVGYLVMTFGCGLLLICKKDIALGWRGFVRTADADTIESVSIPLSAPSAFRTAFQQRSPVVGPPPADGNDIQGRLWKLLHCDVPREIMVAPIVIRNRVVNLLYAHAADCGALPPNADANLNAVCNAATEAFVELIKSKRSS